MAIIITGISYFRAKKQIVLHYEGKIPPIGVGLMKIIRELADFRLRGDKEAYKEIVSKKRE